MKTHIAIFIIAAYACASSARGQNGINSPAPCPAAVDTGQAQLLGRWRAELPGRSAPVLLQLTPHPLLRESVHGTLQRDGSMVLLSGDVDQGQLTLEESTDGKHISANWLGTVQDGSCGKEIRGTWNSDTAPPTGIPFVLRKQAPE